MTDQHPITPPPELVQQWIAEIWHEGTPVQVAQSDLHLAACAAQWGADQELKACCAWLDGFNEDGEMLRLHRRPKPPSLKKQALEALDEALFLADDDPPEGICSYQANIIRRALEALPDD